jgi:hypothetical protein
MVLGGAGCMVHGATTHHIPSQIPLATARTGPRPSGGRARTGTWPRRCPGSAPPQWRPPGPRPSAQTPGSLRCPSVCSFCQAIWGTRRPLLLARQSGNGLRLQPSPARHALSCRCALSCWQLLHLQPRPETRGPILTHVSTHSAYWHSSRDELEGMSMSYPPSFCS